MIFCFSNQKADASTRLSDTFIANTIGNVYKIFNKNVSDEKLEEIKESFSLIVRKLAHVTIYLILGILVFLYLNEYNINYKHLIMLSILICFIYAISDEIHQLFIPGRSGEIRDVLIDTLGSFIGSILTLFITRKKEVH